MHPIGQHISITIPAEDQLIITEKPPVVKAVVKAISPDISVPYLIGSEIYIAAGRQINLRGKTYIHSEHTFLYR